MHVLTKIFIVLVSLLAVFLVPLVVVYAHNEDSYKARYQQEQAQAAAAREALNATEARHAARESAQELQIQALRQENAEVTRDRNEALTQVTQLESQLATAQNMQAEIRSDLALLARAQETSSSLSTSLLSELQSLRSEALASERQNVELDEALRDVTSQLEVAVAARRALQEELQRLTDERARLMDRMSEYVARFGSLSDDPVAAGELLPDRNLTTTVTGVERSDDEVLVEIGVGSRDGVKEGWTMTVGRGSEFLGKIRIISVDINRSTGLLTLEDPQRGRVDIGDVVQSYAGID